MLVLCKKFVRGRGSPLTSRLQLRSLNSEGMPLWKGIVVLKSHIRGAAVSWPRPQEEGLTCAGQEGSALSWVSTLAGDWIRVGLLGAARAGSLLQRDRGSDSHFVPPLASWASWNGLATTSKPDHDSTRVVHTGCFSFFFLIAAAAAQCETKLKHSVWNFIFSVIYVCRQEEFFFSLSN